MLGRTGGLTYLSSSFQPWAAGFHGAWGTQFVFGFSMDDDGPEKNFQSEDEAANHITVGRLIADTVGQRKTAQGSRRASRWASAESTPRS